MCFPLKHTFLIVVKINCHLYSLYACFAQCVSNLFVFPLPRQGSVKGVAAVSTQILPRPQCAVSHGQQYSNSIMKHKLNVQ